MGKKNSSESEMCLNPVMSKDVEVPKICRSISNSVVLTYLSELEVPAYILNVDDVDPGGY